jgi:DNA-binding response OmpR family regulator
VITDLTMPKVDGSIAEPGARLEGSADPPVADRRHFRRTRRGRDRAATMGATDFIQKGVAAAGLIARLEVLVRLSTTREALAESHAALESSRTVDGETELLNMPFFDKQVEKLISFAGAICRTWR